VRKGVRVRGIKVVDAETKRAAREALAAAAAAKLMEVDVAGKPRATAAAAGTDDDEEWREATPPGEES